MATQQEIVSKKSITVFGTKCAYCKKEIIATKEQLKQKYREHLANCEKFKAFESKLNELDKKGILLPYIKLLRTDGIEKDLRKLLKKYHSTPEELIRILEIMEES